MSAAQTIFVLAFAGVTLAVAAMAAVVLRGARLVDGGAPPNRSMLRRLGRLPTERSEANRWAFYLHRLSGLAIFGFLTLHIVDVSLYALSPTTFDEVHALYGTAPMRVFECGLLLALLFHALNGLRLILVDLLDLGPGTAGRLLSGVTSLSLLLTAAGSAVIVAPIFSGGT